MPKKDTKKKTAKPKVLKQKQKQKQTQNVTINIKNGTTKAPRKTATKPPPTQKLYPQVYPVFMNYDMPPPPFYNTPKIEQTEPVKIFVSPKIETEPIKIQTPMKVPDAIPITVKPKRKYTRRTPIIDNIPPMTVDISSLDGSPVKPMKSPMIAYPKVYSPAKSIEGNTDPSYDTEYSKGTTVTFMENPMPKTKIIRKRHNKISLFGDDLKGHAKMPEGYNEMMKIGGIPYKEPKMATVNNAIKEDKRKIALQK
jgi:hypothetical protein